MNQYTVISFTYRSAGFKGIQELVIDEQLLPERLKLIKKSTGAGGLMYLATCNRVEFIFSGLNELYTSIVSDTIHHLHPEWENATVKSFSSLARVFKGEAAVKHFFEVASSLDSLIVGEREIITQVRNAYDWSHSAGLTDDYIRILMRKAIETAKSVYTDTKIAEKPVSVMSLACRKLQEWRVTLDSRVLMVGAGQTAETMVKYLSKHGFKKFTIFNRTLNHAKQIAEKHNVDALPLSELENFKGGFDLLITCVNSPKPIINTEIFEKLCKKEKGTKYIVDLGVPFNITESVHKMVNVKILTVANLKTIAAANLMQRKVEMKAAKTSIKEMVKEFNSDLHGRRVEIAMSKVPEQIHIIKENALSIVFSKEIETLNPSSREVLEKVVNYLEKKYIGIPMQMAKEIIMNYE